MSLKDAVEGVTGTATVDPEQARSQMLSKVRQARQAYEEHDDEQPGSGWITKAERGRVAFSPTRPDGQQLVIGGQAVNFWQEDEIPAMLDAFERAIAAGELDPQLVGGTPAGHLLPLDRLTA